MNGYVITFFCMCATCFLFIGVPILSSIFDNKEKEKLKKEKNKIRIGFFETESADYIIFEKESEVI